MGWVRRLSASVSMARTYRNFILERICIESELRWNSEDPGCCEIRAHLDVELSVNEVDHDHNTGKR